MGKITLKASPTTFRDESARSEHGWNVLGSQPSVGSKLRTETVRGAAPIPERPPVVTFVIVVSVINPFSPFQKVYKVQHVSVFHASIDEGGTIYFPEDTRGQTMRCYHIQDHPSSDRSSDRGELPPAARDIAQKMSSRILPIRESTIDPIYDGYPI